MGESTSRLSALGSVLATEFESARRQREELVEGRWIKDERQYRGILEPEIAAQIKKGRSKAVHRLTKVKVDTIKSRLMGLIFPATGSKNWAIKSTPYPEVHPVVLKNAVAEEARAAGIDPSAMSAAQVERIKNAVAAKAREKMEVQIQDHLVEGEMGFAEQCSKIVFQGVKLGTGVLKGPLPERRRVLKYSPQVQDDGSVQWDRVAADEIEYHPAREHVSVWSVYPDMSATDIRQARFLWQTHLMSAEDVLALKERSGFYGDVIDSYLSSNKDGDAVPYNFEQDLRRMGSKEVPLEFRSRYRVLERWGYLSRTQLEQAGMEIPSGLTGRDLVACVWMIGSEVIKCALSSRPMRRLPYYFFNVVEDEATIFPEGVAHIMRNPARVIDAGLRMMLDNAGVAAGPIIGLNNSALNRQLNPDPENVHGLRVYFFDDVRDMQEAMAVWNIDSHTTELMNLIQFMSNFADETTAPRFMQGDGRVKGAGETASGLSMLMGAANVNLKDLVMFFDQQITEPFITAMYDWEMRYNPRSEIKGDFAIQAIASASLVAKEVQSQQLLSFAQTSSAPRFAGRVKDDVLLKRISNAMDVDADELVRSEDEYQQWLLAEAVRQAKAQLLAVVEAMEEKGIPAQQVLQQVMAQAVAGMAQARAGTPGGMQ